MQAQGHRLTEQSLLQRQSEDYRALIDSWRLKADVSQPISSSGANIRRGEWFDSITDLWARQTAISLQEEVSSLRKKLVLMERWKGSVTVRIDGQQVIEKAASPPSERILNVQEKRALVESISSEALLRVGLKLGSRGELLGEDGVIYFPAGWATGLRKLLNIKFG